MHFKARSIVCCDPCGSNKTPNSRNDKSIFVGNDADLAREMNELTAEEREKILDDVHGVARYQDETQELIDKSIRGFNAAIETIPPKQRKAFNRAMFLEPSLETNKKFKLMFLRADHYDAQKAADRMVKYFDQKIVLFGEEKLTKRITIDDLSGDDLEVFKAGCTVELPVKDQTARSVFFYDITKLDLNKMSIDSMLRCFWYLVMATIVDDTAQIRGICAILYSSVTSFSIAGLMRNVAEVANRSECVLSCVPFRYSSFHICYDNPQLESFIHALRVASGKDTRLRLRAHFGSNLENEYSLLTFGIQCESLLQRAAQGNTEYHENYIRLRRYLDKKQDILEAQEEAKSGIISYPKPNDVLVGRGVPYRDSSGNMLWNRLLNAQVDRYVSSTDRFVKTCISMEAVKTMQESYNGRFLQRTSRGWTIVNDVVAREKAATALQNKAKVASSRSIRRHQDPACESASKRIKLDLRL